MLRFDDADRTSDLHENWKAHAGVGLAEPDEGCLEFLVEGPRGVAILAGLGLERLEPLAGTLIDGEPAEHGRAGDRGPC
jgi:hypothetical protein